MRLFFFFKLKETKPYKTTAPHSLQRLRVRGLFSRRRVPPGGPSNGRSKPHSLPEEAPGTPHLSPLALSPAASPGSPRFALGESPLHTPLRQCRAAVAGYLLEVVGALASPPAGTVIRVTSRGRAPRPLPRPLKTAPPSLQVRSAPPPQVRPTRPEERHGAWPSVPAPELQGPAPLAPPLLASPSTAL